MSGDWVKIRTCLIEEPEVIEAAAMLGIPEEHVCGCLLKVWSWFDLHTENGRATSATRLWLDTYVRVPGFADAMILSRWFRPESDGSVSMVAFDRHNAASAKHRSANTLRQQRLRASKNIVSQKPVAPMSRLSRDKCATREEKRREEKKRELDGCLSPKPQGARDASGDNQPDSPACPAEADPGPDPDACQTQQDAPGSLSTGADALGHILTSWTQWKGSPASTSEEAILHGMVADLTGSPVLNGTGPVPAGQVLLLAIDSARAAGAAWTSARSARKYLDTVLARCRESACLPGEFPDRKAAARAAEREERQRTTIARLRGESA